MNIIKNNIDKAILQKSAPFVVVGLVMVVIIIIMSLSIISAENAKLSNQLNNKNQKIINQITKIEKLTLELTTLESQMNEYDDLKGENVDIEKKIYKLKVELEDNEKELTKMKKEEKEIEKARSMSLTELDDNGYIAKLCKENGMSKVWFDNISTTESTYGKHYPSGTYNAWGWGVYGKNKRIMGSNWYDASEIFIQEFVSKYGHTPTKQSMRKYCPSGAYDSYFL